MLEVRTLAQVSQIITDRFGDLRMGSEKVDLGTALGRRLSEDILSQDYVPGFNRSTVDGYALISTDVFGCSESIPAILRVVGESVMGEGSNLNLEPGECVYVPTGGDLPVGADAVAMLEHVEDFGDGTIGVLKACAPGTNLIFKGDDLKPGQIIYQQGKLIKTADIGTLAALGLSHVTVKRPPRFGLISTGDEIVGLGTPIKLGQIYDVNAPMLHAALVETGARAQMFGIFKDDPPSIRKAMREALDSCDGLIVTGGTSVGIQDAIPGIVTELGDLLVHGIAAKPGKPTLVGAVGQKPVFGLPGNPVPAFFMFLMLVKPLVLTMMGGKITETRLTLPLARTVPSNHGREDLIPVKISNGQAHPIMGKSGLITTLSNAEGYIRIPREIEGVKQNELVEVILF